MALSARAGEGRHVTVTSHRHIIGNSSTSDHPTIIFTCRYSRERVSRWLFRRIGGRFRVDQEAYLHTSNVETGNPKRRRKHPTGTPRPPTVLTFFWCASIKDAGKNTSERLCMHPDWRKSMKTAMKDNGTATTIRIRMPTNQPIAWLTLMNSTQMVTINDVESAPKQL